MSDPKLIKASVQINYKADDGYSSQARYGGVMVDAAPGDVLIEALEELARLTALFGLHEKAKAAFDGAQKRVADFHASRKEEQPCPKTE